MREDPFEGLMELPCGCWVPIWKGRILRWLIKHRFTKLFDLLHGNGGA